MDVHGIEGMSDETINLELRRGAKFVMYEYCVSILIMTFKRPSKLFFVKANESRIRNGVIYSIISIFFGWWGIPWGPIYTVGSIFTNLSGGKDVTADVIASMQKPAES